MHAWCCSHLHTYSNLAIGVEVKFGQLVTVMAEQKVIAIALDVWQSQVENEY